MVPQWRLDVYVYLAAFGLLVGRYRYLLLIPAMRRTLFTEEEIRLSTERRLKYLGAAKVNIYQIHFDPPLPRDLDAKNLNRLREVFRKNQCRRLDVDNHVPATVSRQDLANALQKANVPQQSLLNNDPHQFPRLGFTEGQLQGLHGRHRIQAGAEVLPPTDRWWMVDLYLDGEIGTISLVSIALNCEGRYRRRTENLPGRRICQ